MGRVGVAIDSLEDMAELFGGIPLERVSTSMTINATAIILLALYAAVARRQGVPLASIEGTIQNDILKEYIARGTYIYPPRPSMRIVTDIFAFCERELPRWNTISISGYHIREAGSTAAQEIGFTLANGHVPTEGAVVLPDGDGPVGQVTSARFSPQLGGVIGMAWVPVSMAKDGATVTISDEGSHFEAAVVTKPFYDPDGEVLRS